MNKQAMSGKVLTLLDSRDAATCHLPPGPGSVHPLPPWKRMTFGIQKQSISSAVTSRQHFVHKVHKLGLNYEWQTPLERISVNVHQTARKLSTGFAIHIPVIQWISRNLSDIARCRSPETAEIKSKLQC